VSHPREVRILGIVLLVTVVALIVLIGVYLVGPRR
jgi:hypothetical protein